jgi:DNA-binding PucR family transcriptional regulator
MTPAEVVEFAESLARVAASGGGPKALAAHLAETTGTGVLLEDAQWRHIATAGSADIPSSARAVVESGAPGCAVRVLAGGTHVAWLSAFGANAANVEYALRLTASAIGVELARNGETGRGRRRAFWERLVARAFHDATAARDDAIARGISPAPAYLAVALEIEPSAEAQSGPAELRAIAAETFHGGDCDIGFLQRGAALLVFVPAVREIDAINARTAATLLPKSLAKRKVPLRLSGGVGTVESLLSLFESVENAEAALAIGRRIDGPGRVVAYDDLGSYPLLYEGADVERLRAFAGRVLAPLRAYDDKHQTELERTLALYFAVGQNVKTAAAQLCVHRHTVFYRLRQIAEICACSLESPHDQLTLRLAVAIDALHSS